MIHNNVQDPTDIRSKTKDPPIKNVTVFESQVGQGVILAPPPCHCCWQHLHATHGKLIIPHAGGETITGLD